MNIRIFLSNTVYSLKSINSSKRYSIFGKIVCDQNVENVSIFVINVKEFNERIEHQYHLIGCISKDSFHSLGQLASDYILFEVNETKSTLTLKTIHLPNFITTEKPIQTQIYLYDFKTFMELSERIDEEKWCLRPDPLSQLLILIRNRRQCHKSNTSNQNQQTIMNWLISILMSLSMFTKFKLSFLSSAFLHHFQFWTSNLDRFYQNR